MLTLRSRSSINKRPVDALVRSAGVPQPSTIIQTDWVVFRGPQVLEVNALLWARQLEGDPPISHDVPFLPVRGVGAVRNGDAGHISPGRLSASVHAERGAHELDLRVLARLDIPLLLYLLCACLNDKSVAAGASLGHDAEPGVHHRCDVHGTIALGGLGKPSRSESAHKERGKQHVYDFTSLFEVGSG